MSRSDICKIGVIAAVLALFILLMGRIGNYHAKEEIQMVQDAVRGAALTCYAVEGAYPDDLAYLQAHYHLSYDSERYFVTYNAFASNLFPDIYVVERGAVLP